MRCNRCHRKIKDATSLTNGLGPKCYEIIYGKKEKKKHFSFSVSHDEEFEEPPLFGDEYFGGKNEKNN